MRTLLLLIILLVTLFPGGGHIHANELDSLLSGFEEEQEPESGDELENLLEGFSESVSEDQQQADSKSNQLPSWLTMQGSLGVQSTINFAHSEPPPGTPDYRGLSMLRGYGELISEADFLGWRGRVGITAFFDSAYYLNDQREFYTDEYLDNYEKEIRLDEAYLQGSLSSRLDLKIGRQIVVWGKSDNIRVTDILNPLDRRWPGMVDIRFLRLPVTMTKLDYFWQSWNFSTIIIHEPRFDLFPVYNGEFYPSSQPVPSLEEPGWSLENQQLGLALNGIFSGWDLALYAASVFPDRSHLEINELGKPYRTYERSSMVGSAANLALGNWLLKAEAAWWSGLNYSTISSEKSRLDVLAGLEFTGFSETTISLELVNRHIFDFDPALEQLPDGQKEDWAQYALRFVKNFRNDTIHLTVLLSSFGLLGADGGFERFQLDYDLTDALTLTAGVVFYESGDYPGFRETGDNDRLLFELEYRF